MRGRIYKYIYLKRPRYVSCGFIETTTEKTLFLLKEWK